MTVRLSSEVTCTPPVAFAKQSFTFAPFVVDLPCPGLLRRFRFLLFALAVFAGLLCFFENFSFIFSAFFFALFSDFARFPSPSPLLLSPLAPFDG